jgi:hypothetical protein
VAIAFFPSCTISTPFAALVTSPKARRLVAPFNVLVADFLLCRGFFAREVLSSALERPAAFARVSLVD